MYPEYTDLGKREEYKLNQRQIETILELCNHTHTEEYLTASYFADKLNVSLRTVQGDMKAIKTELEEESCAHIESKASKRKLYRGGRCR